MLGDETLGSNCSSVSPKPALGTLTSRSCPNWKHQNQYLFIPLHSIRQLVANPINSTFWLFFLNSNLCILQHYSLLSPTPPASPPRLQTALLALWSTHQTHGPDDYSENHSQLPYTLPTITKEEEGVGNTSVNYTLRSTSLPLLLWLGWEEES